MAIAPDVFNLEWKMLNGLYSHRNVGTLKLDEFTTIYNHLSTGTLMTGATVYSAQAH